MAAEVANCVKQDAIPTGGASEVTMYLDPETGPRVGVFVAPSVTPVTRYFSSAMRRAASAVATK